MNSSDVLLTGGVKRQVVWGTNLPFGLVRQTWWRSGLARQTWWRFSWAGNPGSLCFAGFIWELYGLLGNRNLIQKIH